jgi:hypothetical protein
MRRQASRSILRSTASASTGRLQNIVIRPSPTGSRPIMVVVPWKRWRSRPAEAKPEASATFVQMQPHG